MLSREPAAPRSGDPARIGPFTVLGRLGAGAMGQVYLGRSAAARLVAVKTVRSELADDADFRERFAREVAAARRVSGAFTAAVVDADPEAPIPWLATVYLPAPTLGELVASCGPLPVPAVRWLAAGCAEALESIHRVGLVHRDLKPSNVLVAADGPKVIDFGLARSDGLPHLTSSRGILGTPAFMAPEQATGEWPVGPAADVFSLGSTVVFAATGHPPYPGESAQVSMFLLTTEPPDLTGLPDTLYPMVEACLARDPGDRPSPAALIDHHAAYLRGSAAPSALPGAALNLIEEYSRVRHPSGGRSGAEPSAPDLSDPSDPPDSSTPSPARASEPGRRSRHRGGTRGVSLGLVGAAAAVTVVGVFGGWLILHDRSAAAQTPTSPTGRAGTTGQPPGQQGAPPPGPQRAVAVTLTVNQPFGDGHTIFVVHGLGWPPGSRVTVSLSPEGGQAAARVSPDQPVVDDAGTFSYAINQSREFFDPEIPLGDYQVRVTDGQTTETVPFRVIPGADAPGP